MARKFSITLPSTALTAAGDLIRVTVPTGYKIRVLKAEAGASSSETADNVTFGLYYATDNGTGSATNVVGLDGWSTNTDFTNAGGSAVTNLTVATTKSPTEPAVYGPGDLSFGWKWEREDGVDEMDAPAGKRVVLRMDSAPVASTAITARLVFELI